jgi:hypothetical protein
VQFFWSFDSAQESRIEFRYFLNCWRSACAMMLE